MADPRLRFDPLSWRRAELAFVLLVVGSAVLVLGLITPASAAVAVCGGTLTLALLVAWLSAEGCTRGSAPSEWGSDIPALGRRLRAVTVDGRVLNAILSLPRDRFVPPWERAKAYADTPLPIGYGQTISQPSMVARMLDLLELSPTDRVLDIGTGSGYHAALLALLVDHVWTIELEPVLSARAERTVRELEIANVTFVVGDSSVGLPDAGPFDAINVAAAAQRAVPEALEQQLGLGGRLVAPVGGETQRLMLARRTGAGLERAWLEPVRFVPLVQRVALHPEHEARWALIASQLDRTATIQRPLATPPGSRV